MSDGKRLFICHVGISMMVLADDEEGAKRVASAYFAEEVDHTPPDRTDFSAHLAHTGRHRVYAEGWDGDTYPYHDYDEYDEYEERTIDECFKDEERRMP